MQIIIQHDRDVILFCDLEEMRESIIESQEENRHREEIDSFFRITKRPHPKKQNKAKKDVI